MCKVKQMNNGWDNEWRVQPRERGLPLMHERPSSASSHCEVLWATGVCWETTALLPLTDFYTRSRMAHPFALSAVLQVEQPGGHLGRA